MTATRSRIVIGTAGHVDHGKTTLIRALTGQDTDRLPEEKARGISIDLGFAPFTLPSGRRAAVIDVPGHERFVHNMLAGVSGIDAVLLVVAADEGVMPQTREHLAILSLLEVRRGLVALTKVDAVDEEWLALVQEDVRRELAGTPLDGAPVIPVSAVTGAGLPALLRALDELVAQLPPRSAAGAPRLPIDRVFTVSGFGTVVTGTLVAGSIAQDQRLLVYPGEIPVRVRGLQVHGEPVAQAQAGERVAANLAGVDREQVRRGQVLAGRGAVVSTQVLVGTLRVLPGAHRVRHNERVHVHVGTAEAVGRVVLLDREVLTGGEEGFARLRLEEPVAVAVGDRFVLRSFSPVTTVGGGQVLDTEARHRRLRPEDLQDLQRRRGADRSGLLLAQLDAPPPRAWSLASLAAHLAAREEEVEQVLDALVAQGEAIRLGERTVVSARTLDVWREAAVQTVRRLLQAHPLWLGVPRETVRQQVAAELDGHLFALLLERWVQEGVLWAGADRVSLPGYAPRPTPEQADAIRRVEAALRESPFSPPSGEALREKAGVDEATLEEVLAHLSQAGRVRRVQDVWFHEEALAAAQERVVAHLTAHGQLTAAEARDLLGTTRKYAVPLLEWLDQRHVTRRVGDVRVLARDA